MINEQNIGRHNYYQHVAKYGSTEEVRQEAKNRLHEIRATMFMFREDDDECC